MNVLFDIVMREVPKLDYCDWARHRNCGSHCGYKIYETDIIIKVFNGFVDNFTGSTILLLNIESWSGIGIVEFIRSVTAFMLNKGLSTAVAWMIRVVTYFTSNCAIISPIILNIPQLCVYMVDIVNLESDCKDYGF